MTKPSDTPIHADTAPAPPLILLSLLTAFGALSIDIVLPGLPIIAADLGISLNQAQLSVGIFIIGMGAGQIFWGWLSDWIGRKPVLLIGVGGYIAVSIACALSTDGLVLLLFRALQGVFSAAPVALSRAVVRDCYDGKDAAKALSTIMFVFFLTPMLAPLVGAAILAYLDWHAMFWFTAIFGVITIALILLTLPETLPPARRSRRSFFALIQTGVQVLTLPGSRGPLLALIGLASGLFSYLALGPLVMLQVYSFSPALYAWMFAGIAGVLMASTLLCNKLLAHFSMDQVQQAGARISFAGGLAAILAATFANQSPLPLIAAIALYMLSFGLVAPNATARALSPFGAAAGIASAMLGAWQTMFAGGYSAIAGSFFNGTSLALGIALFGAGSLVLLAQGLDRISRRE